MIPTACCDINLSVARGDPALAKEQGHFTLYKPDSPSSPRIIARAFAFERLGDKTSLALLAGKAFVPCEFLSRVREAAFSKQLGGARTQSEVECRGPLGGEDVERASFKAK